MRNTWAMLVIVLVILAVGCGCAKKQSTTQPNTPPAPNVATANAAKSTAPQEDIDVTFQAAIDAMVKKDEKTAADEVNKAVEHVKSDIAYYGEGNAPGLGKVSDRLQKLAGDITGKTVKTDAEVKKLLTAVDYDLGKNHLDQALVLWAKKDAEKAGVELHAAAGELTQAGKWAGKEKLVAGQGVVKNVSDMGARLAQGASPDGEDVKGGIDKLGKEFIRLEKDLKPAGAG